MDLSEYWQENRGFALSVAAGIVLFLLGLKAVDVIYGADLKAQHAREVRLQRELGELTYQSSDRDRAGSENEELLAAVEKLRAAALFEPRPEFVLGDDSPSSHFHRVIGRVRDDILPAAARAGVRVDKTLGLPKLSPTKDAEIERTLEGMDVVERVVRIAIEERVNRVDEIHIRLDPGRARAGSESRLERTKIEFRMIGPGERLAAVLARTQRDAEAGALMVHAFEMNPSRARAEETQLKLTLAIARFAGGELFDETEVE